VCFLFSDTKTLQFLVMETSAQNLSLIWFVTSLFIISHTVAFIHSQPVKVEPRPKHPCFCFLGTTAPIGSVPPYCLGAVITLRHITFGRTPINE